MDRIRREYDTTMLQEFVNNVTYCDIESETDMRTVDPNFVKLFKLAQLIIEYLIVSYILIYWPNHLYFPMCYEVELCIILKLTSQSLSNKTKLVCKGLLYKWFVVDGHK